MARIPYPDSEKLEPEVADRLRRMGSLNVTRMMAHQPGLMVAYSRMGVEILRKGTLDPVLREVLILRVGQLCRSPYEHHQHVSVARAVGMDEATLAAIEEQNFSKLDEKTRAALAITDAIYAHNGADAETLAAAASHFCSAQLVEICLVTGYYIMTAGYLNTLGIEIEDTPPLGATMAAGQSRPE